MVSGKQVWLGLAIGNSRRHWALFDGAILKQTWDSDRNQNQPATPEEPPLPLVLASVVPQETALWQNYPDLRIITPDKLPLQGLYPTLGIDRALAVFGGGRVLGWPILAIDAGTALTFTGADLDGTLVGGAILPGLKLQLSSLAENTAALPPLELPPKLPQRWARNTPEAIYSGTIYTILAGIRDFIEAWQQQFPHSKIAITGGDRSLLLLYLQEIWPHLAPNIIDAPHLVFWGMREWKLWTDTAEF